MPTRPPTLKPNDLAERLQDGRAILVDIREPDEFARRQVKGAVSRPLSTLSGASLGVDPGKPVVFACRSGMRTEAHCERLAAAAGGEAFILEGGLEGWIAAGLPVEANAKAPMEIMRQVQITAGLLVLLGIGLGLLAHPAWLGLSAFIGSGLTFAGVTGWCGMAAVLGRMPWNRPARG